MAVHGPPFGSKRETGFPRPARAPADFACEVCQHARSDKRGVDDDVRAVSAERAEELAPEYKSVRKFCSQICRE